MSFTVSHPLGRIPTFAELLELAREQAVQINGNDQAGEFSHPRATGNYTFAKNGEIRGEFTGHLGVGIITGIYMFMTGKVEVTIAKKPFLIPEGPLKSNITEGLKGFCAKFPPLV